MPIWRAIRDDIRFVLDRDPAAVNPIEVIFLYPGFQARELHRLAHALWRLHIPFLPRALSHLSRFLTGIEIHPGATLHGRCFIDHGMGVVIGETAEIGDGCHLHQGVTLGGTSTQRSKRHPTLGADVTVGAGAQVIGAVTVGTGAKIGAGSVVVGNVPEYATVVGVPGHVVSFYDPGNETVLRLPDPEHDRLEILEQRVFELESRLTEHEYPARHDADAPAAAGAPPGAKTPAAP
jgi:serine O-acetyltransferase